MKKVLLLLILVVFILSCKRYDNYEYCLSCQVFDKNTGNQIHAWYPCYAQESLADTEANENNLRNDYPNDSIICKRK